MKFTFAMALGLGSLVLSLLGPHSIEAWVSGFSLATAFSVVRSIKP
jgi:hypothetical protein